MACGKLEWRAEGQRVKNKERHRAIAAVELAT